MVDSTDRSRYTVRIVPAGGDGAIKIETRTHLTYPASSLGVHSKIKDRSGNVLQLSGTNRLPREYVEVFYDVIGPTVKAVLGSPAYESSPGKYKTPGDFYVRYEFEDLNSSGGNYYTSGVDCQSTLTADAITITRTGSATVLYSNEHIQIKVRKDLNVYRVEKPANETHCRVHIRPTSEGTLTITLNSDGITDRAGNALKDTGSTRAVTCTYDARRPIHNAILGPKLNGRLYSQPQKADRGYAVNGDFAVGFRFNQPIDISTFTADDITITGTGRATVQGAPNGDNSTYWFNVRPTMEGAFTITLNEGSVTNPTGSVLIPGHFSPSMTVTYETTRPTVAMSAPATATGPYDVTFTFSEPIDDETLTYNRLTSYKHPALTAPVTLTGPGSRNATIAIDDVRIDPDNNTVYRVQITPAAAATGNITATLAPDSVEDYAGNTISTTGDALSVTTTVSVSPDTSPPTVVVSRNDGLTTPLNAAFHMKFDFSENPANLENLANPASASHISVTPTTATVTSGPTQDTTDATLYRTTITPTADGDVTVSLTTAGVEDAAGNAVTSTGSTTFTTVSYETTRPRPADTTSPTVVVSRNDGLTTPVNAAFVVKFDFSFS